MRRFAIIFLLSIAVPRPVLAQQPQNPAPNPVNLWLVELKWTGDRISAGTPVKLTRDNGTNSQPSFSPDGKSLVFSGLRGNGPDASSDIYRIDLATGAETRVTKTPENENSPTVNAAGEYVAVRWVPATLFREYGVWMYSPDGTPTRGVLRGPDTTGYYTPLGSGHYALTRPKSKTFTIALFDSASGAIVDVDSGVPALPAQLIPGQRALSYVQLDTADGKNVLRRVDLATKRTTRIGPTIAGRAAHAWVPGRNTVLMAKGNMLYARGATESSWRVVARFEHPDLRNANAYVVSPNGDRLVLTSAKRPTLNVLLRDSLDAGHSGLAVAALANRMRAGGQLNGIDVTEGPISALGDDRIQRRRFADGVALHMLATSFFPRSYRAMGRLGDAQRAAGDSTSALASYRRALDLNPRATEADRAAATALERKISGQP
jgi:dipeptidyl aminopeptidase/acylaminoacyl peptidase